MSDERRSWWRPLIGILLLSVIPLIGFFFLRPTSNPQDAQPASLPIAPPANRSPVPPAAPTLLGRAELIDAAALAARALSDNQPSPPQNIALAGRRFTLRLPFGCGGPTPVDADLPPAGWSYDAQTQTLRGQISPEAWTEAPWAAAASGGEPFEAAEGFWITRPWSTSESCPPAPGQATKAIAPLQTMGIARFINPGSSRAVERKGQSYRFSKRVPPEEAPDAGGLRLVLEGRLSVDPSRQPIGCWSKHPDVRPICIFKARLDRVAVTDASGNNTFAEWKD